MCFWWILSLTILIACFILIYRLFVTSYEFLPAGKKFFFGGRKDFMSETSTDSQEETIKSLRNKLQSVEETASFYEIQFSKFQQRLKMLEEQNNNTKNTVMQLPTKEGEDWKEMYYEENELKEKLENELDETRQKLEEAEQRLHSIKEENSQNVGLKSDYDSRLNDLASMQNNIGVLQRQLEAAAGREKELEEILLAEISLKKKYAQLESAHLVLKIENEELRREIVKLHQKERPLDIRFSCLNDPEKKDGNSKKKKKKA